VTEEATEAEAQPEPEAAVRRRRTVQVRRPRRRRLRFWLLTGGGVLLLLLAALGADLYLRYLPAARALRDGQTAADQANAILRAGVQNLTSAKVDQLDALLARAQDDFGAKSRIVDSSWLLDVGGHLPFAGDQVAALRGLRATGTAGAQLGRDFVPVLRQVLPTPGAGSGSVIARLTAFSEANPGLVPKLTRDFDAVDAAVATIPATTRLLGPLSSGRTVAQDLVPRLASVRPAVSLLGLLPEVAGAGQHRYLLLLQNPGEERPGGGFIGAVGEVTLSEGKVTARNFRSSDFANTIVLGIRAPKPLDEALFHGQSWQLSDSNWSPDFPTSAAEAAHFYQLATGETVDGVIGVDPIALGYVLQVTGPVGAPPYPQVVDPKNALVVLNEIINKARPGDPGKAYLAPFGAAVLDHILAAPPAQIPGIAAGLLRAAREKHVVLSFSNTDLMARADGAGFSGRVTNPISDALEVVDANVGANKADLFVTRSYGLVATIGSGGEAQDTVTLRYHNTPPADPALRSLVAQFGGQYRDYVRVYVPEQATLTSMTVQDTGAPTAVSAASVDYELQREAIGYLLVVPPGHSVTLTVTYIGAFVDTTISPAQYTLVWTKEIGAPPSPISVTLIANGRRQQVSGDLGMDRSFTLLTG
jgi:hypothetical protein